MFDKISLAKKLSIGFGVVLLLLASVGFIAYGSLEHATEGFDEYRSLARHANLSGRVQANMLMVRMNVKDYIQSGSEQERQQFNDSLEKTAGFLSTAQDEIEQPERARLVADATEKLKRYQASFKQVVDYREQRNQDYAEMAKYGAVTEENLLKILQSARDDNDMASAYPASLAMRHLLFARLYVMKFLDTNTRNDADRVAEEYTAMKQQLETIGRELQNGERRRSLAVVQENMQNYLNSFNKIATVIYACNEIISGTLELLGPQIAAEIEQVKLSVKDAQDTLGPQVQDKNAQAVTLITFLSCLAIALGVGVAVLITRAILRQMGGEPAMVVEVAKRVAEGDLEMDLPNRGEASSSLYAAIRLMVEKLKEKTLLAQQIAAGDLSKDITLASERDLLGKALQGMVANLNDILGQVQVSGEQIASGSSQVSDASQSLSQGATESASSLEEISASLNQLASQTSVNAENANQANLLAGEAQQAAQQGGQQMESMVTAMGEINEAGQNISKIIKTIDEIAFQTNLLALNAAVEAARAGQHGKGFAVVAEEVRNLAARSAKAAEETSELIEGSVAKTENGSAIANRTAEALQEIFNGISKTSGLVAEIAAASNEQAQGVSQISQGVTQIDQVTQQNTASAEESAAAAEELSGQAESMKQMLGRFVLKGRNSAAPVAWKQPEISRSPGNGRAWPVQVSAASIPLDDQEFGRF